MNKNIRLFLQEKGFSIDKNRGYGKIDNYEVNFRYYALNYRAPVIFHISCYTTDEQKRNITKLIKNAAIKFLLFNFTEYGLCIGLNDITVAKLVKRLDDVLTEIFNIIKDNNALDSNYCPVCGEIMSNSKKSTIGDFTIIIDNECVACINKKIDQENLEKEKTPNNYLKGFLGACIGGAVGAIIAVILIFLGYITSLSAYVAAFLGSILYLKFGGKKNKMMIVIVLATTIIFMLLTIVAMYIYVAGNTFNTEGLKINYIDAFSICMENDAFRSEFISNLIMTIIFSILGVLYQAFNLYKMTKKQKNI